VKIIKYRKKGVEWWLRIGSVVFCGKNLKTATLFFSERNGYKPSVELFGWLLFIDKATL